MAAIEVPGFPADEHLSIRVVAMPADANAYGDIFGGWLLSHIDMAGAIAAIRRAGGRVATVAINSVEFHRPVLVGDLVSFYAQVAKVGTTSLRVDISVFADRQRQGHERCEVTRAAVTYVALDADGHPRPVPPVT